MERCGCAHTCIHLCTFVLYCAQSNCVRQNCMCRCTVYTREVLKTRSWPPKLVPVVFVFLLVNYLRKHLGFRDLSHFWGVCNFLHFESFLMGISMGQFPDIEFAYYAFKSGKWIKQTPTSPFWGDVGVKKWSQILDSGTQSPIFGHLKMGTFPKNGHFQACRQGSPRVAKGCQGPRGTPGMGEMS